jgi:Asp-tRNA(Asn)/Glu-tRNA(Gln) amidotransferase A subunit family amidase
MPSAIDHKPTVMSLAEALAAGRTTSRERVERALARIADPAGEGARTFIKVYTDAARAADALILRNTSVSWSSQTRPTQHLLL